MTPLASAASTQHLDLILIVGLVVAVLVGVGALAAFGAGARAGSPITPGR